MTKAPLISVIVPIYNVAGHVAACVRSLQDQRLTDFEVLLVDDGATDDSGAIALAACAGDARFRLISQKNQGLSGARNTGLDAARGAFIAFVDSDDQVMPDYLLALWTALEETGADWVACAVQSVGQESDGVAHSAIHGASDLDQMRLPRRYALNGWPDVIRHFPSAWNKLYRATLIAGLRFDEGTWFEDHSFFLSAASRTDHLLHLPQALYVQTRGRAGQITASDSDRVFEQFAVLDRMREIMQAEPQGRANADLGFAQIASRLLFERSTQLRDPARRARFAAQSAAYLAQNGIPYTVDWDADIGRGWALEMAGDLVLSVVLVWEPAAPDLVEKSLRALDAGHLPGYEVIIVCDSAKAAAQARGMAAGFAACRVVQGGGVGRNIGVSAATGRFVLVLDAGDCPAPWALQDGIEVLLRDGSDLGLFGMRRLFAAGHVPAQDEHSGFVDMRLFPKGTPPKGVLEMTPDLALTLAPDASVKLFSRALWQDAGLRFGAGADAVFTLWAALVAGKVSYLGGSAVAVDMAAPARRVPASGLAFLAAHHAALGRVPDAVRTVLPIGWERRLYGRALAEQVYFAQYSGRGARLRFLAFAAIGALTQAYKTPQIAGMDPAVGPRLQRILDPVSVALEKLRLRKPAPELSVYNIENIIFFPLNRQGIFRFRVNFSQSRNINLNFRAAPGGHVLLHISVRLDEGVVVCNDQGPSGQWRAERKLPVVLSERGAVMMVEFGPPAARILLDDVVIFDLAPRTAQDRAGYKDFSLIQLAESGAPLQTLEVIPQMPQAGVMLDPRFVLRAAAGDQLLVGADGPTLDLLPASGFGGGDPGVMAALPGRVWQDIAPDAPLVVTLTHAGQTSSVTLTRAELAQRISALLDAVPLQHDSGLALTVLEHIRYGDLLPLLSPRPMTTALQLAQFYGLAQFLQPPTASETTAPAALPVVLPPDLIAVEIDRALARMVQSQTGENPAPPLAVFERIAVSRGAQTPIFRAMSEFFCSADNDFAGFAALAGARGLLPLPPPQGDWETSVSVPFFFVQNHFAALEPQLWALAAAMKSDSTKGWIATAPFAWIARETLMRPAMPTRHRDMILFAFCDFVIGGAARYWSRGNCVELIRTAAHLLLHRHSLPPYLQDAITGMCVRAYGLSPQFWALVGPQMADLPPDLQRAAAAFGAVRATTNAPQREAGLRVLRELGCVGIAQFGRELLGPARVAVSQASGLTAAQVLAAGHAPAEAALRHMAAPNCGDAGIGLSDMVARALPSFYPEVPKAPMLHVQANASHAVKALLDNPDSATPQAIADVVILFDALAHAESQYIGFGLCYALMRGLPEGAAAQDLLRAWFLLRVSQCEAATQQIIGAMPALHGVDLTLDAPLLAVPPMPDMPAPSPLFDTIVMVFSCKPYLHNRVPALRDGWLAQLRNLEIPYVFVIGDGPAGEARLDGDILTLDAPDNYEGLPQKTLAAIRWVHGQTGFSHMLKMDDDCFVNAPLFFGNLSYRKFDYYGRKLARRLGQMDRVWHQEKSASARGKLDLDKSLEPSTYADGGSGYTLSRHAMSQAIAAADSPEGRQLIAGSFMEDKMLGDLLAMRGVQVEDEDYYIAIRRRTYSAATPVSLWLNSFYPSQTAPIVQVHMDTHLGQAEALARLNAPGLWPRKIWPSYQDVRLGYQSNALELVSSEASVLAASAADVAVVACMRNEMFMLPHFLAHYRKLGVTAFLIADNCSDDGTLEYLAAQPDVALFSVDTDYSLSQYGVAWQQAMIAAFRVGKWSLMADADELLVWEQEPSQSLPDLLAEPDFADADAVRIFMLDMYPQGPLEGASFASGDPFAEAGFADSTPFLTDVLSKGPFSDAQSWTSALRHRLIPGSRRHIFVAQKLALLRYQPTHRLSAGLHYVGGATLAPRELVFGHFKYNADFRRKAVAEVARGQHFNDAEEYRKYLALTSEGRSVLYEAGLSLPWAQVPFIKRLLRGS